MEEEAQPETGDWQGIPTCHVCVAWENEQKVEWNKIGRLAGVHIYYVVLEGGQGGRREEALDTGWMWATCAHLLINILRNVRGCEAGMRWLLINLYVCMVFVCVCLLFAHLFRHEKLFNKRCECCRYIKNKQIICISLMQITQSETGRDGGHGRKRAREGRERVSLALSLCGVVIKRLVIWDWQNGVRDINAAVNQKSNKTLHTFRRQLITQIRLCVSRDGSALCVCVYYTCMHMCKSILISSFVSYKAAGGTQKEREGERESHALLKGIRHGKALSS